MNFYLLEKLVRQPMTNDWQDGYGDLPRRKLEPVAWYFAESLEAAQKEARRVWGARFSGRHAEWIVRQCERLPNGDWSQKPLSLRASQAAAELGRKGGASKSKAKTRAARANGAKGGRPKGK